MAAATALGVPCELCGVELSNEAELKEHLEMHAEKVAEGEPVGRHVAKCAFCGAPFVRPEELRDHHAIAHRR
jgi:hypothetical protein